MAPIINPYDGIGIYDDLGYATYFISLPKSEKFKIKIKELYEINGTIFLRFDNGGKTVLTNPTEDVLKWNFTIPKFNTQIPEYQYKVFVYHDDDTKVITETVAAEIMRNCAALTIPKKCGNGVLTIL